MKIVVVVVSVLLSSLTESSFYKFFVYRLTEYKISTFFR